MIINPENVWEKLQNDIAAQVMVTLPFSTMKFPDGRPWFALTEDEGDVRSEYDTMLSVIGISVVVKAPTGKNLQPDIPGPLIGDVSVDVWITETPLFNRSPQGTGLRLSKGMTILQGALHGFQPPSVGSPIYFDSWDKSLEAVYAGDKTDNYGVLRTSRILHFKAPQVAAQIT